MVLKKKFKFFLFARTKSREESPCPSYIHIFILFRADERAKKYLCTLYTFFFLCGQKEKVSKKEKSATKTPAPVMVGIARHVQEIAYTF